ncbi:hypothetical protein [Bacteroides rodentium]
MTAYDKNGNIRNLQRYGQTVAATYGMIDNLTFTLNGNRLSRVDDAATASAYGNGFEFKDGAKQADEYAYDANPKVKVETQFSPCVSPHIFEAAGLKRLSVGMGLHKPTAPPHR